MRYPHSHAADVDFDGRGSPSRVTDDAIRGKRRGLGASDDIKETNSTNAPDLQFKAPGIRQ